MSRMHLKLPLALLGAAFAVSALAQAPKLVVQAVTQALPSLPQYTLVDQPMLRDGIAKATNNQVEVKLYSWPERSVNGPEVLRLVRSGQVDIAAAPLGTVAGDSPILDSIDLTGMNPTAGQARRIAEAMTPIVNKDLERLGIKMVATYPFSAQVVFCRKPINSLADLKGLKIRTAGASASDFMKAVGAQPVSMAVGEVYSALERGAVDCGITGAASGIGLKWVEVVTHMYALPIAWSTNGYFVNLAWWNKLDPAIRSQFEKTMAQIQDAQWKLGDETTRDGIACSQGKAAECKMHTLLTKPIVVVMPKPEDIAWAKKNLADDVLPSWVKRCGDRCGVTYNEVIAPISGVKYVAK
jgi:TRAP-type C4-dicarboxylate transport system substrate-binding protein